MPCLLQIEIAIDMCDFRLFIHTLITDLYPARKIVQRNMNFASLHCKHCIHLCFLYVVFAICAMLNFILTPCGNGLGLEMLGFGFLSDFWLMDCQPLIHK